MRVKKIKIIKISGAWFKHQKIHNHHISINFVPSSLHTALGTKSGGYLLYCFYKYTSFQIGGKLSHYRSAFVCSQWIDMSSFDRVRILLLLGQNKILFNTSNLPFCNDTSKMWSKTMIILKRGEKKTVSLELCLYYFRKWRKGVGRLFEGFIHLKFDL